MSLSPGTRLGPYEVLAPIGAGGMGEVYAARDQRLGRDVAVKVLPTEVASDAERLRRFEQEARATAALNHANVLSIFDFGNEGGVVYLVTELLAGETLEERLRSGPLPAREALEIAAQIAEGLAAAHEKKIVHRDLKPGNLFLTRDARAKILDFGLAKMEVETASLPTQAAPTRSGATAPGVLLGTIGYMSPEQVRGLPADERSDLFSLGAILYEMLTGERAFGRASAGETMGAILHEAPQRISRLAAIAPGIERVVLLCLEKSPADRVRSARDLAIQLRGLLRDSEDGRSAAPRRSRAIDSVAVLPFVNDGGDADAEYLSDGLAENLIYTLSQLPKLRVMARSTVFRFKGREIDPRAVGRELDVRAVLSGRVTQRGEMLLVQVELVDVATGAMLWGERYSRPLADLIAVQDAIAREITEKLRLKLSGKDRKRLSKRYTGNTTAYQAYLKGRFCWNKWTVDGIRTANDFFEQAIALDASYALAYAGLADSYAVLGNIKEVAPTLAFPRAKAAARKALELDPDLAEAHTSLGFVHRLFDWDWAAAEQSFRRAIELNPAYATAHRWYGHLLSGLGRHEEAIREALRAIELDPLSMIIHTSVGDVYFYARRYEEAIGYYRRAIEMDPTLLAAHSDLARALEHNGELAEAIVEYERAIRLVSGISPDPTTGLANVYAVAGRRDESIAILEELKLRRSTRYVSPWALASIYARLGDAESALQWLEKAYEEHDSTLVWIHVHPRFDVLRADPRFTELVRRMGLG